MFFAADRERPIDPDDIRSLTQPFTLDPPRCRHVLDGYQQIASLTGAEWEAMPWLIRSQWLQIRLRGSRKVPPEQKLAFVFDGFFQVVRWLDEQAPAFFERLRSRQL